ncbi:MAG: hypothetical protein AAGE52_33220 [Myxococcota bacterium]
MRKIAILAVALGCATLGNEAPFPDPIQTSGTGPFRRLDLAESGVPGNPPGRAILITGATTGGMFAGDHLFYVAAAPLGEPPERAAGLLPDEVDWAQFEARAISRTPARANDLGHELGDVILEASEAWEGDAVFDPWVVLLDDGRARLYYAGAEGVGVAEAPSVDGSFSRVAGPIINDVRSPSVVRDPAGGWLMFVETSAGISVARSDDGVAFGELTELSLLGPTEDGLPTEVSVRRPGAVTVQTPTGRTVVRVYFEVVFSDETRAVAIAGSEDGSTFERRPSTVYAEESPGSPAPFVDEDGVTRLYVSVEDEVRGTDLQARAIVMTVAPAFARFAPEPVEE